MSIPKWAGRALALWLPLAICILCILSPFYLLAADQTDSTARPVEAGLAQARELFHNGRFQEASQSLVRTAELARRTNNLSSEGQALLALSACRILLFDYRGAQQAAESARAIALQINDNSTAGAASVNLATIYLQLGDFPLAGKEAAAGADLLKNSPNKERLVKALLIYANVEAERYRSKVAAEQASGDYESARKDLEQIERNYQRGIDTAHAAGLGHLEANLWEELGYSLLLAQSPEKAAEPLHKAYLLEAGYHDEDALAVNYEYQAQLQLQKRNYRSALTLIDQAFASKSESFKTEPKFYSLHIRGVLLEHLNRRNEALVELRKAVDSATEWRQGALPGDATSTRTVVVLHDVYHDYAQLAADMSLSTHDPALAREALEALAQNRAANLREQITLALSRKLRLPPQYFDLLSELQSAQARVTLGDDQPEDKAKLEQVRLEIGNVENEFGLRPYESMQSSERTLPRNSLKDIQARLSRSEVLLSFSLGRDSSFLWAVTEDQVNVFKLAGERRDRQSDETILASGSIPAGYERSRTALEPGTIRQSAGKRLAEARMANRGRRCSVERSAVCDSPRFVG